MTTGEMVEEYLRANGYDGLYSEYQDCCCALEEKRTIMTRSLLRCEYGVREWECEPGYIQEPGSEDPVGPKKIIVEK